jgi:predicted DNA-binding transcriptional regulator AlpA
MLRCSAILFMIIDDQRLSTLENLLLQVNERLSLQQSNIFDEILDVKGAAKLLHRSEDSIYRYTSNRQIPHSKPMGTILFSKKELLEWVNTFKIKTISEINNDADAHLSKKGR